MTDLKPGYFNQKPLLKGIKDLRYNLGIQDSCIQTNEVALRFLEENSIEHHLGIEDFIKSLCVKYSVSLGTADFKLLKQQIYESYIVQTYNIVEPFFKQLNKEYKKWNNFTEDWLIKKDGQNLDPYSQLLLNLPAHKSSVIKKYPESDLLNYYRLLRNSITHLQLD